MSRTSVLCILTILLASMLAATVQAQVPSDYERLEKAAPRVPSHPASIVPGGTGTVQYDPGAPADTLLSDTTNIFFGNLFDTASGNPLDFPGTLTQVSWYQGSLALAAVLLAQPGGPSSYFVFATGGVPSAFNALTFSHVVNGSFFGGMGAVPGLIASVGARSASYNSQGFHGRQRNANGSVSNSLQGLNVMFRATGNVVIPVELLEFDVD
jgi:hypothetical protein